MRRSSCSTGVVRPCARPCRPRSRPTPTAPFNIRSWCSITTCWVRGCCRRSSPTRSVNEPARQSRRTHPSWSHPAGRSLTTWSFGGEASEVAQQPFGLAVFGRYTFVADPANHVVRLLIDNTEVAFAGAGSLAVAGDGPDPAKAQLAGPYAVAIGDVSKNGFQVTGFDVYIADTYAHQVRKAAVTIPSIDNPTGAQTAVITTIAR